MQKKNFFPAFLIFFIFTLLIYIFSQLGLLKRLTGFFERGTVPIQRLVFNTFADNDTPTDLEKVKEENDKLATQVVNLQEVERENRALRDQFAASGISSGELLAAEVIGGTNDKIIIDKGERDNVRAGNVVVFKDNLIGQIAKTSATISVINVITNDTSFTAKTVKNQTQGVIKGLGHSMIFDNVTLSDKLEKGEIVLTQGDVDENGQGFPPDLVIGKIASINKKASSLFQSAEVRSLVNFGSLEMVFVRIED